MALPGTGISKYLDMPDTPAVLVDNDSRVLAANPYSLHFANKFLAECDKNPFGKKGFECIDACKHGGCGNAAYCSGRVIRTTVMEAFLTGTPVSCRPAVLKPGITKGSDPYLSSYQQRKTETLSC